MDDDTTNKQQKIDDNTEIQKQSIADVNNIVKNHIIASMTLGLVPIPLFDLISLTSNQMSMLRNLATYYDVDFDDFDIKTLITSLVGSSLPVLSIVGLSSFVKLIPGIGSLAGSASLSIVAGSTTYAIGQVFIMHFEAGGTLEDFEVEQAREFFKREFDTGKSFVKEMHAEVMQDKSLKSTADAQKK